MGIINGQLANQLLKNFSPPQDRYAEQLEQEITLDTLIQTYGNDIAEQIPGKTIIDFGCGPGKEVIALALHGAKKAIGLDIQPKWIAMGKSLAQKYGVKKNTLFTDKTDEKADLVLSRDAFEHFSDPALMLQMMHACLKPGGQVLASFGPTWLHPYGGHFFSIFPWAHLIFSESALIQWRANYRHDGATRFIDVDGGLNQLTIRHFEKIVDDSPLKLLSLETVPIRGISVFRLPYLREFGSSLVRCRMAARD